MSASAGHCPYTADDLLHLPEDGYRHELYLGHLLSEPPAGFDHGDIGARILIRVGAFVQQKALGRVLNADTGFILARAPDTVRAPDVAFVSKERLKSPGHTPGFFLGAPDLAVEVLSPSERSATIGAKVADYLASGTRMVWVVDPELRTISVHRTSLSVRVLSEEQDLSAEEVLPGFSIRVSDLFSD